MQSLAEFLGVASPDRGETTTPTETLSAKAFCRAVLSSEEYRRSILQRITLGELPPALEMMIWDRAHGKTVEKVKLTSEVSNPLDKLTPTELRDRLHERVARLQTLMVLLDEEPVHDRQDDIVH